MVQGAKQGRIMSENIKITAEEARKNVHDYINAPGVSPSGARATLEYKRIIEKIKQDSIEGKSSSWFDWFPRQPELCKAIAKELKSEGFDCRIYDSGNNTLAVNWGEGDE